MSFNTSGFYLRNLFIFFKSDHAHSYETTTTVNHKILC